MEKKPYAPRPLIAGMISLGLIGGAYLAFHTHTPPPPSPAPMKQTIHYTPTTLPEEDLRIILKPDVDGMRTALHYTWEGREGSLGIYVTPRGIRVGTLTDWYETLSTKEKVTLLVRLGQDLPHISTYVIQDIRMNWPNVQQDIISSLEQILSTIKENMPEYGR